MHHKPVEHVHNFRLPIFDAANIWIIATDDIQASRRAREGVLGSIDSSQYTGLCSWDNRGKFFLFFTIKCLDHSLIAHEVFHLTHRILEYCEASYHPQHSEAHAHLCGWLTNVVYQDLARWGVGIKRDCLKAHEKA
jgi:hypothetical protein